MGIVNDTVKQLSVLVRSLIVVLLHPTMLIYPLAATATTLLLVVLFLMVGAFALGSSQLAELSVPVVSGTAALFAGNGWIPAMIGAIIYLVFIPVALMFFRVAYTHEINEMLHGRRPVPFEGLVVAVRRFRHVVVAGLLVYVGSIFSVYLGAYLERFLPGASRGTNIAYPTVTKFVGPAVVTHDGSLEETFNEYLDVLRSVWQGAAVSVIAIGQIV